MTDTPLTAEDDFLGWVEAQAKADFLYSAEDLLPQAIEYGRSCEREIAALTERAEKAEARNPECHLLRGTAEGARVNYRADRKLRDVRCAWCGGVVDRPPSWIRSPRVGCCRDHERLLRRLDGAKQRMIKATEEFQNIMAERRRAQG